MTTPAAAPLLKMLLAQTRSELLIRWRVPAFSVTNLVLPIVFFIFFGLPIAHLRSGDGVSIGAYLLASFGAYAVGNVMVYGFGIGVANERGMKIDRLMRASPLPPFVFMLAKVVTALLFALLALVLLIGFGIVAGGIRETPAVWATIITRLLAGSLPFIALGFAIGYSSGPNAAPALANLIFLPLAFASGLFMPLRQLPDFVQRIAPYLPTYHYGQLAWSAVGAPSEPLTTSLAWLAGYTLLFMALTMRAYRREQSLKFA
jgi:ABC-2 type transport system permease protein